MIAVCSAVIRWGFYLLFFLVPLILTPWNYELFEYNKMMTVYGLTVIIVGAWVIKMALVHRIRIRHTPFDIPILLFAASQFVSSIFSIDTHVSWFGYYSRFNGGVWSVISYVLLYYAFVSNLLPAADKKPASDIQDIKHQKSKINNRNKGYADAANESDENSGSIRKILRIIIGAAVLVAVYGFLEHFGIDKHLWVQDVQSRVFSTLGQPNWLAAYLVAVIPLVQSLAVSGYRKFIAKHEKPDLRSALKAPGVIGPVLISAFLFLVLLYTRSRAGYLGLAAAEAVFWGYLVIRYRSRRQLLVPAALTAAIMALIVFFNGTYIGPLDRYVTLNGWRGIFSEQKPAATPDQSPAAEPASGGTLLETGGTESGTIRKYVWQAALDAWKDTPKNTLIGSGTETFAWTFFRYRPAGHNLVSEWDFLYNKAHNEYLNYLATTGILGIGTYAALLVTFIIWSLKILIRKSRAINRDQTGIAEKTAERQLMPDSDNGFPDLTIAGLFAGWISILVTNFFGFSVVIMQVFLFLYPAIAYALQNGKPDRPARELSFNLPRPLNPFIIIGSILVSGYLGISLFFLWYADTLYASGYRMSRSGIADQAQPAIERAISMNGSEPLYHDEYSNILATLAVSQAGAKNYDEATRLAQASLNESNIAVTTSPNNVNFWKTRTKVFYLFSTIDPQYNKSAIDALKTAEQLSPNDPKITYNLAILAAGENDTDTAIQLLKKTKILKPNYRDAYNAIYLFYNQLNQPGLAKQEMAEYLSKVDPNDGEFKSRL